MHPAPEQSASVVAGQYQKVKAELPDGTLTVWLSVLSPLGSVPDTAPSSAEPLPVCAFAVLATGGGAPPVTQLERPLSKPLLRTEDSVASGVTAFEAAEGGPLPFALLAVTVKVYVVPLVRPLTIALVGAGEPVTVVVG